MKELSGSFSGDLQMIQRLVGASGKFQVEMAQRLLRTESRSFEFIAYLFFTQLASLTNVDIPNRFASLAPEEIEEYEQALALKDTKQGAPSDLIEWLV